MTRVANNVPEQAQTLELARSACDILGVPTIPETRVWMADPDFDWYCKWLRGAPKKIMIRATREKKKEKNGPTLTEQLLAGIMHGGENTTQKVVETANSTEALAAMTDNADEQ